MSNVHKIEEAIVKLPPRDLAKLREWFAELDARDVDRRLEKAVKAGHFDALAEQALKDLKAGKCAKLWRTAPRPASGNTTMRYRPTFDVWRTPTFNS